MEEIAQVEGQRTLLGTILALGGQRWDLPAGGSAVAGLRRVRAAPPPGLASRQGQQRSVRQDSGQNKSPGRSTAGASGFGGGGEI
jgi:hypothetical protein